MCSLKELVMKYLLITMTFYKQKSTVNGFGINLIKVPDDDVSQVVCSMALLRKYFNSGEALSGSVLYVSLTTASVHTQKKLLEAIHDMNDFPWSIVIRDPKNLKFLADSKTVLHEKPQSYFIIIENLENEDLEDIFEDWKITINWNPLAQFVVYLSSVEETEEEMTELMIEILLSFMNKKIYNVNVIGQSEENSFYYGKTVFPYHPDNNCGNRVISIETLDLCDYNMGDQKNDNDDKDFDSFGENDDVDLGGDDGDGDGGNDVEETDKNGNESGVNNSEENSNENTNFEENNDEDRFNNEGKNDDMNTEDDKDHVVEINNDETENDEEYENDSIEEKQFEEVHAKNEYSEDYTSKNKRKFYYKNMGNSEKPYTQPEEQTSRNNPIRKDAFLEGLKTKSSFKTHQNIKIDNRKHNYQISRELTKYVDRNVFLERMYYSGIPNMHKKRRVSKTKATQHDRNVSFIFNKSFKQNIQVPITKSEPKKDLKKYNTLLRETYYKNRKRHFVQRYTKLPKFMRLEAGNSEENSFNQKTSEPNFYFEEVFRGLFLDKFPKDLSGCPLAAAYRPWEPYIFPETTETTSDSPDENSTQNTLNDYESESTISDYDSHNFQFNGLGDYDTEMTLSRESNGNINLAGIEYQLLQTIGERLHMNIDLQVENTNLYHLFQQLIDGDIEMVIGGIDEDPSISQYVSTTIPYHQDDLTWCVAKAKRSHSLFNFLASFSLIVWLVSLIYILLAALTITWIQHVLRLRMNGFFGIIFRVFGIIFNQSMPMAVKHRPLRLAFFSAFFMALIFINAYQSFLISTLTTPKSAYQISRVEEIYQNRMIIKGSVENVRHLSKEGEIFKYIREKFQMCYNIEECLIEAAENENIAVAVSRQHSFYNPRIPRSRLYCFDRNENLYMYLVTMLLPKKFHLLHKINPVIQYVIESGHMQKWARDLDMRRRIIEERSRAHEEKFRSLTLGQVVGTFVLAGALLSIALLAFMLECFVYRHATRRRRRRLKIIKYLHRQFLRV